MPAPRVPAPETASLPSLEFAVESVSAVRYSAAPTVAFTLLIGCDRPVRSLALTTQIRIAPARRRYSREDEARLTELFGAPERWAETLRTFRWTQATQHIPGFEGETRVELAVPATYDFEIATAKYFYGLDDGDVPLELLFSGTVFYDEGGSLRTAQIPWESEAAFRMPVGVWKDALEAHFPGSAWLRVSSETFARLSAYRGQRSLPTWDAALATLLEAGD